jgi:fatty acid CoA ligase FadD9
MLFQQYQSELDRRRGEFANAEALDAAVKADIRTRFLGGRLLMTVVGSAPMSAEMKAFAEECTGIPLHDGYGTTEFGICMIDNRLQRPPILEYKLVDVPELGYFRTDKPYPRGEFVLKSSTMFPGYYRRPEVTATVFDEDGFYRTGDVMAEIGPDQLVYVDRRNNVQKLSQGEFVTVSTVESVFTASPLIRQIYVYGSSERAYLLAVIVPAESALARVASPEELRPQLVEALQETATQAGLASYEIPRDFLIETEQFSMANGLLSDIRKLLRPRLRERYGELLEQRYAELETGQEDQLRALRRDGAELPVTETIARAVQALLGRASAEVSADGRFTELGGDSLTALSFSRLLQEIFDIEVPVGVVISPATTLRSIADYVEKQRRTAGTRPAFSTVHGADTKEIRAGDLRLDKFLDQATVDAATHLPGPAAGDPKTVLLTGATGYLGRFMCIDWLERLAETGGKLVCLVRGADLDSARKRLDGTFDSGDPELLPHYRELAAGQLEVLAGDLGEPELGLDHDTWLRLASEVDVIMHPGALVNHVLPYEQLFGPNVVGTAELIRLAITGRLKPFTYLSTVGIADQIEPGTFLEAPDVRVMSPVRQRNEDYANGYSMSKWAAEVLLREAHERCGLPVTVFRSDMILTHSRYTGQLNLPDMFTRLLLSLVSTGIAPKSFYRLDAEGNRPNAHYDGLPADFSAEAVDTLGAKRNTGYRTYHLMNPHEDGISLDTYVDWLVDAGYEITRVDDYADWLRRFEAAVRALPEPRRQHSILPLLHSYQLPQEPLVTGMAPADEFRTAVQENKIGADGDIPHVTRELIVKYITDLHQLDLL